METATVSKNKIAEKAYEIFKSRGGKPGREIDDWLKAERELTRSDTTGSILRFKTGKKQNSDKYLKYA